MKVLIPQNVKLALEIIQFQVIRQHVLNLIVWEIFISMVKPANVEKDSLLQEQPALYAWIIVRAAHLQLCVLFQVRVIWWQLMALFRLVHKVLQCKIVFSVLKEDVLSAILGSSKQIMDVSPLQLEL